jgi:hypothetical protein
LEGVLLASLKLRQFPDAHLMFAEDMEELQRKIDFAGVENDIEIVGFESTMPTKKLLEIVFGKHRNIHSKFSRKQEADPMHFIDLVLRHRDSNPSDLVKFLNLSEDVNSLFLGKTKLQKRFYSYMREVKLCYHRLCMFSRPTLVNGILTVNIKSKHKVEDMFCRWLAGKNPDMPVAVIHRDKVWLGNGHFVGLDRFIVINSSLMDNIAQHSGYDEVEELWDIYYDSQMIESRRNKKQAKKLQPKTASSLSNMSMKDRYKVEKGISSCKLGDFFKM